MKSYRDCHSQKETSTIVHLNSREAPTPESIIQPKIPENCMKMKKTGPRGDGRPKFAYVNRHFQWHALVPRRATFVNVFFTTGLFAKKNYYHEYLMAQEIWNKVPLLRLTERNWVGKVVCISNFCAKVWREDYDILAQG